MFYFYQPNAQAKLRGLRTSRMAAVSSSLLLGVLKLNLLFV